MRPKAYRSLLDQLSTLLESGIPILEALATLGRSPHRGVAVVAERLRERIQAGSPLPEALASEPAFPPAHVALIGAAERAGAVPPMLDRLRDEVDRAIAARRDLLRKSAYPIFVLVLAAVLPPLYLIFQGRLWSYLALELGIFGSAGAVAAVLYSRREQLRAIVPRLPVIGSWLHRAALGESLSLLGLLVGAGIGVQEALEITAGATRWPSLSVELRWAADELRAGKDLRGALGALTGLPAQEQGIIASGERSGTIDRALVAAGRELEDSARRSIARFLSALPVVLYFLVAVLVGIMYLKTMIGYLSIGDSLR